MALTREGETTLRLHAVWALKNLLYKADLDVKREVMRALSFEAMQSLLVDAEASIQEQSVASPLAVTLL